MIPPELRRRSRFQILIRAALCVYLTTTSAILSTGCEEGAAGAGGASAEGGGGFMSSLGGLWGSISSYAGTAGAALQLAGAIGSFDKNDTGAANNNQIGGAVTNFGNAAQQTGVQLKQREEANRILETQDQAQAELQANQQKIDAASTNLNQKNEALRTREQLLADEKAKIRAGSGTREEKEAALNALASESLALQQERTALNQELSALQDFTRQQRLNEQRQRERVASANRLLGKRDPAGTQQGQTGAQFTLDQLAGNNSVVTGEQPVTEPVVPQ